jgi:alkylation response protein AidB-like acyl-CoA dehydrogenase
MKLVVGLSLSSSSELILAQLIINTELARCGTRGYMDGLLAGGVIGLPPVLNFGAPELQAKIVPDVLAGKKFICLAISEAFAGSDVGGMQTYAHKDGNEWVISGTKKYLRRSSNLVACLPPRADALCEQMDNEWHVRRLLHRWL